MSAINLSRFFAGVHLVPKTTGISVPVGGHVYSVPQTVTVEPALSNQDSFTATSAEQHKETDNTYVLSDAERFYYENRTLRYNDDGSPFFAINLGVGKNWLGSAIANDNDKAYLNGNQWIPAMEHYNMMLSSVSSGMPLSPAKEQRIADAMNMPKPSQIAADHKLAWKFDEKYQAFAGHDILDAVFDKVFSDAKTMDADVVDEYGYSYIVPGQHMGKSVLTDFNTMTSLGELWGWVGGSVMNEQEGIATYDHSGVQGLTLDERKMFFNEVQRIFDANGVKKDARKEYYGFAASGMQEPCTGGEAVWADASWTYATDNQAVRTAISESSVLTQLALKSEQVRNGKIADDSLSQQYSILVTDNTGNRLANDRIIIAAKNGNQIEMHVDKFRELDRYEIAALLA